MSDAVIERSLTPQQVAELEQKPVRLIYDLIRSGEIRAYKLGRHYRITADELRRIRGGAA